MTKLGVFLTFPLLLSTCGFSLAGSDNAGTKNGNFLKLATDARGVALGDSIVSTVDGADALRWNPAALSREQNKEVSGTHIQYYQGVQVENVAAAYPMEESALAVSAFYLSAGTLDGRDSLGNPTGNFPFYDAVGTIGYGRKMLSREEGLDLSVGAAVKIVEEKIDDQTYQNPAFDLGLLSAPIDNMNVGLTVRNMASSKANFAREIIAGTSYAFLNRTLVPALAVNYANDAPLRLSVSGEYRMPDWQDAAVRIGYTTHDALDDSVDSQIPAFRGASVAGLTMGAGFTYRPPIWQALQLGIDYAMAPFAALGISHTITVKAKW